MYLQSWKELKGLMENVLIEAVFSREIVGVEVLVYKRDTSEESSKEPPTFKEVELKGGCFQCFTFSPDVAFSFSVCSSFS
jgi:hypothetical protein